MKSPSLLATSSAAAVVVALSTSTTQALHVSPSEPLIHPYHPSKSSVTLPRNALSSSSLFGLNNHHHQRQRQSKLHYVASTSALNLSDAVDAEITTSTNSNNNGDDDTATTAPSSTSLLQSIDNFGMKLKPWALSAHAKSRGYKSSSNGSDGEATVVNGNTTGYRGFFVILPAVFREVFRQLEESNLVVDAFDDDSNDDGDSINNGEREFKVNSNSAGGDLVAQQQPMRLRTRVTITVLSSVLTLSYVVSGALQVLGKFIKTFTTTTSVESSLEAAADQVVRNEDNLRNNIKQ
ncbi:predicted protein [Thalassiosira pseudonana CCMP1335]|uniref:Uncharacterized protein n=1 Tax=Thalassiosira pseudonana TaxID=35128 RepID=B5YLL1_THAPS|nr:predicted protein [Thalassiosira pseudonana CCMP1335]ACI64252.1 predicted protein [Thalassiosira pseudonana CCMP1335]